MSRSSSWDLCFSWLDSQHCWYSQVASLVSVQHVLSSLTRSHPVLGQRPTTTLIDMHAFTQERKKVSNINTSSSSHPVPFILRQLDTYLQRLNSSTCLGRPLLYSRRRVKQRPAQLAVHVNDVCVCVLVAVLHPTRRQEGDRNYGKLMSNLSRHNSCQIHTNTVSTLAQSLHNFLNTDVNVHTL